MTAPRRWDRQETRPAPGADDALALLLTSLGGRRDLVRALARTLRVRETDERGTADLRSLSTRRRSG